MDLKYQKTYKWLAEDGKIVVEEIEPGLMGKHILLESIIKMMEVLNEGDISRSRFIFWFDN